MATDLKNSGILEAAEKARLAASAANEGKGESIVTLDLRGISSVTDFFVIVSGQSITHVRALGKRIEDELALHAVSPSHIDGDKTTAWLVYDFGNVIVHAMTPDIRRLYDLERLWGDAPRSEWE